MYQILCLKRYSKMSANKNFIIVLMCGWRNNKVELFYIKNKAGRKKCKLSFM